MYGGNLTANMSASASAVTVDFFNLQSNGHTVYLGITGSRNITGGTAGDSLMGGEVADTAILFATLSPGLALTSADFIVGGP